MKTLILIRHGKSSWEDNSVDDSQRILLAKGINRSLLVGDYLKNTNVYPDLILSSHAVRAYETAKLVAGAIGYPITDIVIKKEIYNSNIDTLNDLLYQQKDEHNMIMMFGHNPGFSILANQFLNDKIGWLPTSGVISVSFDCTKWNDIPLSSCHENFVIFPKKMLRNEK